MNKSRISGLLFACTFGFAFSTATSASTVWEASWGTYSFSSDLGVGLGTQAYCAPFVDPFTTCEDILHFDKDPGADWTLAANQDLITGGGANSGTGVTLTRADKRGLFNIAQETQFEPPVTLSPSPVDTAWAYGSTADLNTNSNPSGTLYADDFDTWGDNVFFLGPQASIGENMVIHLITDDIYLDFRLLSWTSGEDDICDLDDLCGGFAYLRANGANEASGVTVNSTTDPSPVPVPAAVWLFASGLLGLIGVARRRQA